MRFIFLILRLFLLTQLTGCAVIWVYDIPSIDGQIKDYETGKPIQGAIVVVQRSFRGLRGGFAGFYEYQETITDENGKYHIPELGVIYEIRRIAVDGPNIIIFKQGYEMLRINNGSCYYGVPHKECPEDAYMVYVKYDWERKSVWDGQTVGLVRFNGTKDERLMLLRGGNTSIWHEPTRKGCHWVGFEIPKYMRAINQEILALNGTGLPYTREQVTGKNDNPTQTEFQYGNCQEQWEKFFKEYEQ
jgi:hypothetical protein